MPYDLPALRVIVLEGVATVTIDNPPLNLSDEVLLPSLRRFITQVRTDDDVRVIVFDSADPDIFIAHGDTRFITEPDVMAAAGAATVAANPDAEFPSDLNLMQVVHEEVRALPQVTIGKLKGLARGGGNEFLMALDMRFAAIGKAGQAQPEVMMGIMAGGGGTQYMTSLVGRARALELLLGAQLVDAELAERYGLVNRALPLDEIDSFVTVLARRIGQLRPEIVTAVKNAVNAVPNAVTRAGLARENLLLGPLFTPEAADRAQSLLVAGMQTREGEIHLEALIRGL
ncbi:MULTISPECIES: enoyl-CoA hydratase/isomerase family protein [unclassified Frondihabitans]|uniref:enoyl-CoA hydratase/isomerase family protein n=1 Tax=unclassified Frondihabitans TaxID=2626248 RepID=UPI000F514FD5|nr:MULTISPECIES: enoyl-CoA hydratase/isomerase family protein [unclassified Frondihabitans]RPE77853.1 enoyl-CoA hydratase/carnithine racemase [Frondihabitans sp. PhB153]RPF08132.1 enoyl-CoA hydratase/carnithine racemase [Frondihabitans sp. PhB161]